MPLRRRPWTTRARTRWCLSLIHIYDSRHFGETISSMTAMQGFQPVGENGEYPVDYMQESFKKIFVNMT